MTNIAKNNNDNDNDNDKNIKKITKSPKRCEFRDCRKKLPLTKFACKCGLYFCDKHRYPNEHNCNFNYKFSNNNTLIDSMKCIDDKVDKI